MTAALSSEPVIVAISNRARGIVRAAGASADKTFLETPQTDDLAVAEAVAAGYLVSLRGRANVWRITARGEAYLAMLRGAH